MYRIWVHAGRSYLCILVVNYLCMIRNSKVFFNTQDTCKWYMQPSCM